MPRFIQIFSLLVAMLALRPVEAFSLLGPRAEDPGGEAWQSVANGYSFETDIGSVKNITEEYRWNKPVITYGFDLSFVNYFGTNGIAAVQAAMAVYNSLPDLSTLSQELTEFPLEDPVTGATTTFRDTRRINYTAQALNILDLKTVTMGYLAEQLGLASPERNVWTLRARETVGPLPVTNYFTIMRNFDPVTYTPSRYVNGNRYTYNIVELDNPFRVIPLESPTDPESALYGFSSIAGESTGFIPGVFNTFLTRDDIGGLRYIYDRDNLNYERFAPGTQIFASDPTSLTLITNIDLAEFSLFTRFNPPAAVQAAYPNLVILSNTVSVDTNVDVVGITITNVRPPWSDPFTTFFEFVPILQTNPVLVYTYSFANVITNYSSPTTIVRTELIGFETEPWSTPDNPIYRTNFIDEVIDLPSGGILIVPPDIGRYEFTGLSFTNVIAITNTVFQTNVVDNGLLRPLFAAEYSFFTNVIYAVYPFTLQDTPPSVLRGGIGKITFQRIGGTTIFNTTNSFFTNSYTTAFITNRFGSPVRVTNEFRLVTSVPDILFAAADFDDDVSPSLFTRSINFVNNGDINTSTGVPAQGGPGNIFPSSIVTFNKVGPGLFNTRPGVATEAAAISGLNAFGEYPILGSYDGSTNPPIVFPRDVTLEDIQLIINGGIAP